MGSFQLKIVENSTAESEGNFGSVLNCSESAEKGELLVTGRKVMAGKLKTPAACSNPCLHFQSKEAAIQHA